MKKLLAITAMALALGFATPQAICAKDKPKVVETTKLAMWKAVKLDDGRILFYGYSIFTGKWVYTGVWKDSQGGWHGEWPL